MKTDYHKRTVHALKWNTISRLLVQLFNFASSVIAARILEPRDFGIMAVGMIVVNYTNVLTNFGFNNALVQKEKIDESHINSVFCFDLTISIFLTVITFSFSSQLADFFNIPECQSIFKVLSILYVLTTFEGIPRVILVRSINFDSTAKIDLAGNISNGILVILLALLGFGYWALIMGRIGALCLTTSILLIRVRVRWHPKLNYNHHKMKTIFNFGIWNFFRAQIYYINKYVVQMVIGKSLGAVQLGFFEKAFTTSQIPLESIGASVNSVMFSAFSRFQKDTVERTKWFLNMITLQTILIMPLIAGLFAISSHFVIVVLGEKWSPAIPPLKVLCLAAGFSLYNGGIASLNIGIGKYKQHTLRVFSGSVLLIVLSLIAVRYSLVHVSAAYLAVCIFWIFLLFGLALRHVNISCQDVVFAIGPYLCANFFMCGVVSFFSRKILFEYNLRNLFFLILIGGLLYSSMVILINLHKKRNAFYPIKNVLS